jgi:hypothetical protein
MPDPNRTERRLLESIRKAKSSRQPRAALTPVTDSPRPSTAPRGRPEAAAMTTRGGSREAATARSPADAYQLGGRVWPD